MNIGEAITLESVLALGEGFVLFSMVAGITVFLYFLCIERRRAIRLITENYWMFTTNSVPYVMNFMVCWYLSLAFEKLIVWNSVIMEITSKHHLASKVILTLTAVVTKQNLFCAQYGPFKIALFVTHLILVAMLEAMSYGKYEQMTINVTIILLFWMTVLILIAPENACHKLKFTETFTWKRCSLAYALVTSICHSYLRTDSQDCVSDAIMFVLVVHVQLVFLCITYFTDGQQLLRNIAGFGMFNPMAESLDIYFTMDSIFSKMNAYIHAR